MKSERASRFSLFLAFLFAAGTVYVNMQDFVEDVSKSIKAVIAAFSFLLVLLIYVTIRACFRKSKKNMLDEQLLPMISCIHCEDLLCCLQSIRPHVITQSGETKNILSLSNRVQNGSHHELTDEFELAAKEAQTKREVWILSPDLSYETKDNNFMNVVKHNLCYRKVNYVFIALRNDVSKQNANAIYSRYRTLRNFWRMKFYMVDDEQFYLALHLYSLVIYDPRPNPQKEVVSEAFLCVGENEDDVRSIYKSLNPERTIKAAGVVDNILKDRKARYRPRYNR